MAMRAAALAPPVAVERRDAAVLSPEVFLREYVAANRPVVVAGAARAWPAMSRWTPGFFRESFGDKLVHVSYDRQMRFDQFIDAILASTRESPGPYMYRLFICDHLPDLVADLLPVNEYAFPRRLASPLMPRAWRRPDGYLKLLIGGVGGRFPVMHYDGENMHAAITEIYGDKECFLYPPEDGPYLYPRPERPNHSQVDDLAAPDLSRFPLLARANQHRTVIHPGDTLFIPSRWWHTTRVLSTSISVCTNMLDSSNWPGFVSEVCASARSRARLAAKRAVFSVLGSVLDVLERMQSIPFVPSAVGRFAPATGAKARDLRLFRPPEYEGDPPY